MPAIASTVLVATGRKQDRGRIIATVIIFMAVVLALLVVCHRTARERGGGCTDCGSSGSMYSDDWINRELAKTSYSTRHFLETGGY